VTQLKDSCEFLDDPLPELLVDLFIAVGNGGFGPQGGLLGLHGGFVGCDSAMTIVDMYNEFMWETPEEQGWDWRAELLPIAEGGCGLVYCLDLDSNDCEIHLLDPTGFEAGDNVDDYITPCNFTLYDWLYDWTQTRPARTSSMKDRRGTAFKRFLDHFRRCNVATWPEARHRRHRTRRPNDF